MKKTNLIERYRSLSLSKRLVISFNIVLFFTMAIISVPALLNRINNQLTDATRLLIPNLNELGMIIEMVGMENRDDLKNLFDQKNPYNTGYASLISADGILLIDPFSEGSSISHERYFIEMRRNRLGRVEYINQNSDRKYVFFTFHQPVNSFLAFTIDHKELIGKPLRNTATILLFAIIFSSIIFTITIIVLTKPISNPIKKLEELINKISKGLIPDFQIKHKYHDEIGQIINSIQNMLTDLKKKAAFSNEIGHNNFDYEFSPSSQEDELGNSLVNMRNSLKKASDEENFRKMEDDKRNWVTQGLATFSDILRSRNDNINELSFEIIKNIVKYLNANQGGIFILNAEKKEEQYLELTACYAYDRRKYLENRIEPGVGLVGTCFLEQQTCLITTLPSDYMYITSGLGDESPKCLLLVPLRYNEEVLGVIELASFNKFEPHQVEFLEKTGESIASTISSVRINQQTTRLLEQSRQYAEEIKSQEEEMRQNMEELLATQEEATRKNTKMEEIIRKLQLQIDELQTQEQKHLQELNSLKETHLL